MSANAFEIFAWSAGIALLAVYGTARLTISRGSESALESFDHAQAFYTAAKRSSATEHLLQTGRADTSLWSDARVAAYRKASAAHGAAPLAVLRIPELNLRVPVFQGTGPMALDRGAGHIEGTDMPGSAGNVGLAAHRDGFFRVLKDVRMGQTVYLDLIERTIEYKVSALDVVEPTNVGVLANDGAPRLTLVTCYPFYYVGPAPKRFIVRAERTGPTDDERDSALVRAERREPEADLRAGVEHSDEQ